ncbi:hypothetical protein C5O75_024720 [Burkholderia cepacia]|nr:hypothetical protein C5O75_024720 [Burkholderia cepacia]
MRPFLAATVTLRKSSGLAGRSSHWVGHASQVLINAAISRLIAETGLAVLFGSHRMRDIRQIADVCMIVHDGACDRRPRRSRSFARVSAVRAAGFVLGDRQHLLHQPCKSNGGSASARKGARASKPASATYGHVP